MPWLLYRCEGDPVPIVKVGVWVGMRAGLDGSRKSHLRPGFEPWTVQPVASDIPTTLCWNMLVYHTRDFITSVQCVRYRARIQVHMQMLKKLQHISLGINQQFPLLM
jgi:hypothetical protein